MRHNKKFNHLGRKSAHRQAMLSNMACSLILHKRITTTLPKAKALRVYVEPILTKSKDDTTHSRREVFSLLQNKEIVTELFREVAQKIASRPGGYTRIIKTGFRLGDAAEMCIIELVDYNENMLKEKTAKKKTTRRSSKKAIETVAPITETAAKEVEETVVPAEETVEEVVEETAEEPAEETTEIEETPAETVEKETEKPAE